MSRWQWHLPAPEYQIVEGGHCLKFLHRIQNLIEGFLHVNGSITCYEWLRGLLCFSAVLRDHAIILILAIISLWFIDVILCPVVYRQLVPDFFSVTRFLELIRISCVLVCIQVTEQHTRI